jgi:SAM-dependent methyltransferase
VSLPCCICASETVLAFLSGGIPIVDCRACGHRQADLTVDQVHIDRTYADEYFTGGGAGYRDYLIEGEMLRRRGARYGSILGTHRTAGSLLDIGSAAGFLAEGMQQSGWTVTGVEPNDTMAQHARNRGLDVLTASAESALEAFHTAGTRFDAAAIIQVIAHVGDPVALFRSVHEVLSPGGVLLIETWDRASVTARVFGEKWHEYSPPSVVHWFTKPELVTIATSCGFDSVATGRYPKRITAAHGQDLVQHRMGTNHPVTKLARLIPSRLTVPYPGDDLFWTIFRRSA